MKKWEYHILVFSAGEKKVSEIQQLLNDIGEKGWEISSASALKSDMVVFLKREKIEKADPTIEEK